MSDANNEIFFNFGDLVRIDGYWPRVFKVQGYRKESYFYPDEQYVDTVFELVDATHGEFLEADYEDLTLVETAANAEVYLRENPAPDAPSKPMSMSDFAIDISHLFGMGAETMAKQERQPTARELSGQEAERRKAARKEKAAQVDNLLEIRKWNADMLAKTNDEAYGDRVFAIDCELKKLTETE